MPKPEEVAKTISEFVNVMGNRKEIEEAIEMLLRDHRTLQQNTMRFMLSYISEQARRYNCGERDRYFDMRNEGSGKLAAEIVEKCSDMFLAHV